MAAEHGANQEHQDLGNRMPERGMPTLVDELFHAIDTRAFEHLRVLFHPEVTYERPGYPAFDGLEQVMRFYREERVIASGTHVLTAIVQDGCFAASWGRFTGVHRDGSPIDIEFADTYVLGNAQIVRRKSYFYLPAV
jgi:uncharacterized protein